MVAAVGCGRADETKAPVTAPTPEPAETKLPKPEHAGLNNPAAKRRAEQVISTFENSTTEIKYGYAENLNDGRGITAGRAGFTSGTHDLKMVVDKYTEKSPRNPLARYRKALATVDNTNSTEGLGGFEKVWQQTAAHDPQLRAAQDAVYDELYFNPAMNYSQEAGIEGAAAQLVILDTIIQHGDGDDVDGLRAMMAQTTEVQGSVQEVGEEAWTRAFLRVRKDHLMHAADPETRQGWAESVDRVTALGHILDTYPDLEASAAQPMEWNVYGDPFKLVV
ncbi:MAG TPA: chitosanase [Nevskiaceae bacterium]|nr:chitosanase [Nevskiaceae bacterium]